MTKIIVVDDSRTSRTQVIHALANAGFEIVEAIDGKDGLAKIAAHNDAKLVLCDINMPNLNGLEMMDALPQDTRSSMSFLMLTTEAEPRLVQRAKELGAKGWFVKPFKPELLLAAVKKLAG